VTDFSRACSSLVARASILKSATLQTAASLVCAMAELPNSIAKMDVVSILLNIGLLPIKKLFKLAKKLYCLTFVKSIASLSFFKWFETDGLAFIDIS